MGSSVQNTFNSHDDKIDDSVLDKYFIRDSTSLNKLRIKPTVEYIPDDLGDFFRLKSDCYYETSIQIDQPVHAKFTYSIYRP